MMDKQDPHTRCHIFFFKLLVHDLDIRMLMDQNLITDEISRDGWDWRHRLCRNRLLLEEKSLVWISQSTRYVTFNFIFRFE